MFDDEACQYWKPYITTIVRNRGVHPSDVDDLVQQVLYQLIISAGVDRNGDPIENIQSYIAAVARNTVRAFLRKNKNTPELVDPGSPGVPVAHARHDIMEERIVISLIRRLTPRERAIFKLLAETDENGRQRTHAEVASQLGVNKKTVQRDLRSIEHQIARLLEDEGIDFGAQVREGDSNER